ncbi:DUF4844 domain-containing protein [Parashewanella hymeniacidonis]|uniref:DUF4844 domain-containing protein n=1 Tax=Parashewanella hymeniacidonis TaxID=2807618 RepID=UPI001EF54F88|nr:DUF4844 domain-containing protein [Parashewanella hymeniacidonis]
MKLPNGENVIDALVHLKDEKKYIEDVSRFYPGAPDEVTRLKAEAITNLMISSLISKTRSGITENEFWIVLELCASSMKFMDSEEMERSLEYMEQLMDIYGIESSDGRLSDWRYGFNLEDYTNKTVSKD